MLRASVLLAALTNLIARSVTAFCASNPSRIA
jgi:hypothetical protein